LKNNSIFHAAALFKTVRNATWLHSHIRARHLNTASNAKHWNGSISRMMNVTASDLIKRGIA
jgi:hypothetical protein